MITVWNTPIAASVEQILRDLKLIIDLYNSHKPLARGYAVGYNDSYCDTTVSAAFIKAGAVDLIGGTECGVEESYH